MRPAAMDDPGARPDAAPIEFVVGPGHSDLCSRWPQAHREHEEPDAGP